MRSLNLFNVIRTSIYAAVILFTVICLAVAANFQSILAASDLTRFIPLSIFVCSFSLLAFFVMLGASWRLKASNPISTRTELMCLGMCGILWLVLGVFLAASPSQSADVDCSSSNSGLATRAEPNVPLSTEKYHAMYHVLNAFALMNATLILAATLGLLFLAYRRHRSGDDHMWRGPVTSCAWFNYNANAKNRRGLLPQTKEKESMTPAPVRRERSRRQSQSQSQSQSHKAPAPAHTRQHSSRRYNGSSSKELRGFDEGFMRNPYSK